MRLKLTENSDKELCHVRKGDTAGNEEYPLDSLHAPCGEYGRDMSALVKSVDILNNALMQKRFADVA